MPTPSVTEQLQEIITAMDNDTMSRPKLAARVAMLAADLQDDDIPVPVEALACLATDDARRVAIMGFLAILGQTLQ